MTPTFGPLESHQAHYLCDDCETDLLRFLFNLAASHLLEGSKRRVHSFHGPKRLSEAHERQLDTAAVV